MNEQYISPTTSANLTDRLISRDFPSFTGCVEIIAPNNAKKNHGKSGYVPVKSRLDSMIGIEASSTLSAQMPVPWRSGRKV